jgi:hypothetical protein
LKLESSKKAVVIIVDKDCPESGSTINFDPIDSYLVVIAPQSLRDIGITLCHEMEHVRQLARGILKPDGKGGNTWAGKKYSKKTPYLAMPWEKSAFAKQEILFRKALED